jgi:signal transduction histidine kinase
VKLKIWLWSSLVLLLTMAGILGLFNYWDQLKIESVQTLQNRLNEIELQHFEEEKGNQVYAAAQDSANNFNQIITQMKGQAEAIADAAPLRQPSLKPSDVNFKRQAFINLTSSQAGWAGSQLTSENGDVIAASGRKPAGGTLAGTPAFTEASRLHQTIVNVLPSDNKLVIQLTVPCLSDKGVFLGAMQSDITPNATQQATITSHAGFLTIIGNLQGQRLFGGPENFPKYLGALMSKNIQETESLMKRTGQKYLKAKWENISYILVNAGTAIPGVQVFTLLEVTGLEKYVGPRVVAGSMFQDPVVVTGLIAIILASLIFLFLTSGLSLGGIKKINELLSNRLDEGGELTPLQPADAGELAKLADLINLVIDRVRTTAVPAMAPGVPEEASNRAETSGRTDTEWDQLQTAYEQLRAEKEETEQKFEELASQNQDLRQAAVIPSPSPSSLAQPISAYDINQAEALLRDFKQGGMLRIEAIQNMSEDLKATLTVIKNYISSILSAEDGKITDSQQEFLGVVINRSARLERQINDLLDISHMESEEDQGLLVKTDLVSMLQDVILNIQPQADTKQIHLLPEIQSPLPLVMINGDRMGQVFINLVQHALKITAVGGEVRIAATETLSDLVIKIRDGGTPLTADQASQVFTAFNGPGSKSGPDLAGTGLRFPIIKRIVDFHHGTIALRGLPDQGNEMVITLPKSNTGLSSDESAGPSAYAPTLPEETPAEAKPESESFFDLSAFMGRMDETSPEAGKMIGGDENLDDLLKDIDKPK